MLARIANFRYIQRAEDGIAMPYSLRAKLEFLLDEILPKMLGCRRKEAPVPEDEPSESDDSDY